MLLRIDFFFPLSLVVKRNDASVGQSVIMDPLISLGLGVAIVPGLYNLGLFIVVITKRNSFCNYHKQCTD